MRETALGYAASGVSVTAFEQVDRLTRVHMIARSKLGRRLYFETQADDSICMLISRLDEPDGSWPDAFHRLAFFEAEGPIVRLRLDTHPDKASSTQSSAWADLARVASSEEKSGIEELVGLALLSLEPALTNASDNAASRTMLSCLQVRGTMASLLASPEAQSFADLTEMQGKPLTALRTTVAEYYTSPEWEHVRLQLDGSTVAGVARDSLTFKVFRTPGSVGIEFRPVLETGEHPFRSFPGTETDQFGQVYRLTYLTETGEFLYPEQATVTPADQQLIDAIIEGLYPTMRAASLGVGHLEDSVYANWTSSGAAFVAAYRLAAKTTQSPS